VNRQKPRELGRRGFQGGAMEAGIMFRWGKVTPGRERSAIEFFNEVTAYFGKLLANRRITFFEPFFFATGDYEDETGYFILKGPEGEINKLLVEEEFRFLMTKAEFLVEHFKMDLLVVGEGVGVQIERFAKVLGEYPALV
jgi:hypothetical protein